MRLAFTGDILSYKRQNKIIRKKKIGYDIVFKGIKSLFAHSDYVCGSLETPIAGKELKYTKSHVEFNTPECFLKALRESGFSLLTTANNHCLDRGLEGLRQTIINLRKNNLDFTGTQMTYKENNFLVKEIKNKKISFISYTYGTNSSTNEVILDKDETYMVNLTRQQDHIPNRSFLKSSLLKIFKTLMPRNIQDRFYQRFYLSSLVDCVDEREISLEHNRFYIDKMKQTIKDAKNNSDVVIFCLHSGGQFNNEVGKYTKYLVDVITKEGADIVVCNHTHDVLPIELVNGKLVAWSLGNFSFTPKEGYYIDGVYADYSIILYIDIIDDCFKSSFSVIKNIIGVDGISRVVPVYDEYIKSEKQEQDVLLEDVIEVINRVFKYKRYTTVEEKYEVLSWRKS